MSKSEKYIEHSSIECHGVDIVDTSGGTTPGERIWVGIGDNGRWLTSREVRELAAALISMANAHDMRLVDEVTSPDYQAAMDRPNS